MACSRVNLSTEEQQRKGARFHNQACVSSSVLLMFVASVRAASLLFACPFYYSDRNVSAVNLVLLRDINKLELKIPTGVDNGPFHQPARQQPFQEFKFISLHRINQTAQINAARWWHTTDVPRLSHSET